MKKRGIIAIFTVIFSLSTTLLLTNSFYNNKEKQLIENTHKDFSNTLPCNVSITVKDMASYLTTKEEHYPLSDEFIERYQQNSGGYIDNAKKAGLIVNKYMHEPNQKWHFFDSWYYASLADGTMNETDLAKDRIYMKLLCPELLLWIYEACEVSPSKVKEAKEVAELGKVNKTHISTVAKNMRSCVPWEDLEVTLINFLNNK